MLFIRRAEYAGDPWSGQVAFPGGREEPEDGSLLDTAIRETMEEMHIDLRSVGDLVGTLSDISPRTNRLPLVVVRPFVFAVSDLPEPVLSHEVAEAIWVPLPALLDAALWRDTDVTAGGISMTHYAFHHGEHVVWGLTERIVSELTGLLAD